MAAEKRRAGPYAAAGLTAELEAEALDSQPAVAHAPWVRPITDYERRETTEVEGLRFG
jgi:hypothetical protein